MLHSPPLSEIVQFHSKKNNPLVIGNECLSQILFTGGA